MIYGLVLSGGQSTRMGSDKGSLIYQGKNWTELACDKMIQAGVSEVYFSINPLQKESYKKLFAEDKLIADQVSGVEGPLKGILSAHKKFPKASLLVMTCDMLLTHPEMLSRLIEKHERVHDYTGFINNPFPGIFSEGFLGRVYALALIGKLNSFSIKGILSSGDANYLAYDNSEGDNFSNFNYTKDLGKLS